MKSSNQDVYTRLHHRYLALTLSHGLHSGAEIPIYAEVIASNAKVTAQAERAYGRTLANGSI